MKDISLDDKYGEIDSLKKPKCKWKKKYKWGNMGQKINPLGFRLGTTQGHHSLWFAQPKKYSEGLQEDQKIRNCIKNYIQKNMRIPSGVEGIARIEIQKRIDLIQVIIFMGFPKKSSCGELKNYKRIYKKELNCVNINRKLNIDITRIEKPYGNPNILAEFIAGQLKNRVSFRKAMKKAIELTEQADTKGNSSKLQGVSTEKEIARVEWIREGRVPSQTIRLKLII
ncbi:hypothetical protein Leryth_027558, partial [Lithospermum erythrorhizon]